MKTLAINRKSSCAFTLVERLAVLVIIAILIVQLLPSGTESTKTN